MKKKIIAFIQAGGGKNVKTTPLQIAKDLGYEVAVFDKNEKDVFGLADYYYSVDTDNIDLLLTKFGVFYQKHDVAAVLTFTEFAVEQTATIASVYGLPGLNVGSAKICRNKLLTRLALDRNNIPQNKFICVSNLSDSMDEIIEKLSFPIVIKPLMFAGSCAVTRVNNKEDLQAMIREVELDRENAPMNQWSKDNLNNLWLCEEYLDGYEISVESITHNGETNMIAIHDKMSAIEGPIFLEEYFVTPSPRISQELANEIEELNRNILKCIGYNFGIAHAEYRVTKDGPRLIEVNARIGGALIGESVKYSTGINMIESFIKLAVGMDINVVPERNTPTAFGIAYCDAGEVKEVIGVDKARTIKGVKEVNQWLKPGDKVQLKSVGYGANVLVMSEESSADAFQKVKEAVDGIQFIMKG